MACVSSVRTDVAGGEAFLVSTASEALKELSQERVPSVAFPGKLIGEIVPVRVLATLAVIEQTDDHAYRADQDAAINHVLNHYGLKREEAYRYSVSSANAIGPMQFTNRRGNGTYAIVVRSCRGANIDPDFERGATDLKNAMKAAACLFDIELSQMERSIRDVYLANMDVLGIFPVAAYNGGPRNVKKLSRVIQKLGVRLEELRGVPTAPEEYSARCPCIWYERKGNMRSVSIPRYNNENRWYIEKYQNILQIFE